MPSRCLAEYELRYCFRESGEHSAAVSFAFYVDIPVERRLCTQPKRMEPGQIYGNSHERLKMEECSMQMHCMKQVRRKNESSLTFPGPHLRTSLRDRKQISDPWISEQA